MKAGKWIGVGLVISVTLVMLGFFIMRLLSRYNLFTQVVTRVTGNRGIYENMFSCDRPGYGMGSSMMGGWEKTTQCEDSIPESMMPGYLPIDELTAETRTIEDAHDIFNQYLLNLNNDDLEIAEVMEFKNNFYAVVREEETGMGAIELLVDKSRGTVSPEMGPNMMWNVKYGMHQRGMMARRNAGKNRLSESDALSIAQEWLDDNYGGINIDEYADQFYGYYTIHTFKHGEIEGMLSVHGSTGQVWYHSWHGAFVQISEMNDIH